MAKFVVLVNFTDQGIQTVAESVKRAQASVSTFSEFGVKKLAQYWTLGDHDIVIVLEAPNDEAVMKGLLAIGKLGNVRTKSLRAFTADEMSDITSTV
ncbi:MAG TPA: GYD domain-containing protein [Ramlibacter sp.]|nr:GYD domain-containing protein [Ramlibacter sp.]